MRIVRWRTMAASSSTSPATSSGNLESRPISCRWMAVEHPHRAAMEGVGERIFPVGGAPVSLRPNADRRSVRGSPLTLRRACLMPLARPARGQSGACGCRAAHTSMAQDIPRFIVLSWRATVNHPTQTASLSTHSRCGSCKQGQGLPSSCAVMRTCIRLRSRRNGIPGTPRAG
jgi:hypothetical protein